MSESEDTTIKKSPHFYGFVWLDNSRYAILRCFIECDFETRTSFVALLDFSSLLTKISFHFCVVYLALLKVIIPTNNQQFLSCKKLAPQSSTSGVTQVASLSAGKHASEIEGDLQFICFMQHIGRVWGGSNIFGMILTI